MILEKNNFIKISLESAIDKTKINFMCNLINLQKSLKNQFKYKFENNLFLEQNLKP